jgi:hypothetical protein
MQAKPAKIHSAGKESPPAHWWLTSHDRYLVLTLTLKIGRGHILEFSSIWPLLHLVHYICNSYLQSHAAWHQITYGIK